MGFSGFGNRSSLEDFHLICSRRLENFQVQMGHYRAFRESQTKQDIKDERWHIHWIHSFQQQAMTKSRIVTLGSSGRLSGRNEKLPRLLRLFPGKRLLLRDSLTSERPRIGSEVFSTKRPQLKEKGLGKTVHAVASWSRGQGSNPVALIRELCSLWHLWSNEEH